MVRPKTSADLQLLGSALLLGLLGLLLPLLLLELGLELGALLRLLLQAGAQLRHQVLLLHQRQLQVLAHKAREEMLRKQMNGSGNGEACEPEGNEGSVAARFYTD